MFLVMDHHKVPYELSYESSYIMELVFNLRVTSIDETFDI